MHSADTVSTYRFAWPRENGDMPTSLVKSGTLAEAVVSALKDNGYSLQGCTVFDADWNRVGMLVVTYPGPVVFMANPEAILEVEVRLSPIRSKVERDADKHWQYADYSVAKASPDDIADPDEGASETIRPAF